MHRAFQRGFAALIWTIESLVRPLVLKVLDLNMFVETIDTSEKFIALLGPSLFVTFAKGAVEGTS